MARPSQALVSFVTLQDLSAFTGLLGMRWPSALLCCIPQELVSWLTGRRVQRLSDGFIGHPAMNALTFCFCALALALGVSVAATPDGHNPLRTNAMASLSR